MYGFGETEKDLKSKALKKRFSFRKGIYKDENSLESIINILVLWFLPSQRGRTWSVHIRRFFIKPLIGTRGTGMEEIISHEYNGYLFDSDSYQV